MSSEPARSPGTHQKNTPKSVSVFDGVALDFFVHGYFGAAHRACTLRGAVAPGSACCLGVSVKNSHALIKNRQVGIAIQALLVFAQIIAQAEVEAEVEPAQFYAGNEGAQA